MLTFFCFIFSYFWSLFFAANPCQGRDPLRKYMSKNPIDSKSSLLDCSHPRWVFNDAYLAVPVRFLPSWYGICYPVFGWEYFLESPRSMTWMMLLFFPRPTRKLSGLMSLWIIYLPWMNSILSSIWSASIKVVFRENLLLHCWNSSSRDFPNNSITMQ